MRVSWSGVVDRTVVHSAQLSRRRRGRTSFRLIGVVVLTPSFGLVVPQAWRDPADDPAVGLAHAYNPLSRYERRNEDPASDGASLALMPVCSGGNRAARKLTCLVDGDTGWENGTKWRLEDVDAAELTQPECSAEYEKAIAARDRLRRQLSQGYTIEWVGSRGSYGRQLVRIILSDGRSAGRFLLEEGLAQSWPNTGNVWCGR
jgi:endonuclease YncB( thermonuclease family)